MELSRRQQTTILNQMHLGVLPTEACHFLRVPLWKLVSTLSEDQVFMQEYQAAQELGRHVRLDTVSTEAMKLVRKGNIHAMKFMEKLDRSPFNMNENLNKFL